MVSTRAGRALKELAWFPLRGRGPTIPGIAGPSWRRQVRVRVPGPGQASPADPSAPMAPQPRPDPAMAPMFHRCRPDDINVPSVLPRTWTGRPAPLRSPLHRGLDDPVAGQAGLWQSWRVPLYRGCVPQAPLTGVLGGVAAVSAGPWWSRRLSGGRGGARRRGPRRRGSGRRPG